MTQKKIPRSLLKNLYFYIAEIRTLAPEDNGAFNHRLRPLGHIVYYNYLFFYEIIFEYIIELFHLWKKYTFHNFQVKNFSVQFMKAMFIFPPEVTMKSFRLHTHKTHITFFNFFFMRTLTSVVTKYPIQNTILKNT